MEPIKVNTEFTHVKWSGMLSYITIYSALWENPACIIQLYSESASPNQFVRNYSIISICFMLYVVAASATAYKVFG